MSSLQIQPSMDLFILIIITNISIYICCVDNILFQMLVLCCISWNYSLLRTFRFQPTLEYNWFSDVREKT